MAHIVRFGIRSDLRSEASHVASDEFRQPVLGKPASKALSRNEFSPVDRELRVAERCRCETSMGVELGRMYAAKKRFRVQHKTDRLFPILVQGLDRS